MKKTCTKCKKPMKQITKGFESKFVCKCGEATKPFTVHQVQSKRTLPIIAGSRNTGRSMLV